MTMGTNAFSDFLQNEVTAQGGAVTFARFMELALYHPEHGYYMRDAFTIGKKGDFTTAAEISPLYAECFAAECQNILNETNMDTLLEIGAGTGRFAGHILSALKTMACLPKQYYILERSHALRRQQKAYLQTTYPDFIERIQWLDQLPTTFSGIVIANEVLDALPVHCFVSEHQGIKERYVSVEDNQFIWSLGQPSCSLLHEALLQLQTTYRLPTGYQSEINWQLENFLSALINTLKQGVILFADYGYGQREYYHPERQRGTLTCFHQHQRHDNPLIHPGEQDITAHVDFTRVIEIADTYGCDLGGFTTQAGFLLANGLIERAALLEPTLNARDLFSLQQQIKTLTMPTEMGERIRIMALNKACTPNLRGFRFADRRSEL